MVGTSIFRMNRRPVPRNQTPKVGTKNPKTAVKQALTIGKKTTPKIPRTEAKKGLKIGPKLKTYEYALELLERRSRADTMPGGCTTTPNEGTQEVLDTMKEWLHCLGHTESDINKLNIIHVAGTKGKGSTCTFTHSFLQAHGQRTGYPKKVGLYTSPDLGCVEERLQINGKPISEDLFTQYFFEIWDRLQSSAGNGNGRLPSKLQVLSLMAFHVFIKEGVDAAIFETHCGGEYDVTNIIQRPVVTAITSIRIDNALHLGPSIEDVAWHKAGIFKSGTPALSAPQEEAPRNVLLSRAAEKKASLTFIREDALLPVNNQVINIPVQKMNCTLALAVTRAFLERKAPGHCMNALDISKGLQTFSCPGRFESIHDLGGNRWFLDAAFNEVGLSQAAKWFAEHTVREKSLSSRCALVFSHSWAHDGFKLLRHLANALVENKVQIYGAYFCTYVDWKDGPIEPDTASLELCRTYSTLWRELTGGEAAPVGTIEEALFLARNADPEHNGSRTLVIGSLELVGGARRLLGRSVNETKW